MRRLKFMAIVQCLLIGTALCAQPVPPPAPKIGFEDQAVVVSGVTPGAQVVVFGVAREIQYYAATLVRRDDLLTAEKDGTLRFPLDRRVPQQSMWVIVDLATGAVATGAPAGFQVVTTDFHGRGLLHGLLSDADGVEDTRPFLEIMLVRPGKGAWGATIGDGGDADEAGGNDGKLRLSLGKMRGVQQSGPPPDRFMSGDVIAVVDPNAMELTLATLPGGHS